METDREAVLKIHPDAYLNEDYSGAPSADVAVFRKATKEDWPNNREVQIGNFCGSNEAAWKSAHSRLLVDAPAQQIEERELLRFLETHRHYERGEDAYQSALESIHTISQLRSQLRNWETWGTVEIAIRNPNVDSYMKHWEGRALAAEEKVAELEGRIANALL